MIKLLALLLIAGIMVSAVEWSIWPFLISFGVVYILAGVMRSKRGRKP